MSFLQKLRSELIDIVEWVDDSRHTLVWRFPRYHNQIKHGARLIVRPGQQAIFVHQGKVADVFDPGTYRLETQNLPVLSTLAGWAHGFDSPFKAEVYFVSTRQVTDLKWGTPNPVLMRDPDFGPIRVRAFGTYTLRACDTKKLLHELVGTDSNFESDEVSELLRSIVNSAFAELVANAESSVLDLASSYAELSEQLRERVQSRVHAEFGLELPQLYIVNISLPAEVERAVDARSSMSVVGNLAEYQQYQVGQSMPTAAANPAGGLAGAGLGLGMGMVASQAMAPAPRAATPTPAAPPPAVPTSWYVVEAGQSVGPWTIQQFAEAVALGRVRTDTLAWSQGMANWLPAQQIGALAALFQSQTPPPPPVPPTS